MRGWTSASVIRRQRFWMPYLHMPHNHSQLMVNTMLYMLERRSMHTSTAGLIVHALIDDACMRISQLFLLGNLLRCRFERLFDILDRDKDGTLDFRELALGLHKFVPMKPIEELAVMAARLLRRMIHQITEGDKAGDKPAALTGVGPEHAGMVRALDRPLLFCKLCANLQM